MSWPVDRVIYSVADQQDRRSELSYLLFSLSKPSAVDLFGAESDPSRHVSRSVAPVEQDNMAQSADKLDYPSEAGKFGSVSFAGLTAE